MCGITGIMAFNELGRMHMIHLAQATEKLKHRGPDYQNTFVEERVGLGHRRLSIIDLSPLGNQPMTDASGRYVIVYNGEIYNYRTLRQQLQNLGVSFISESDTEVLLQMYIHYGAECLSQLNGCFALAIYDNREQEIFLARDRMGINPLLYYMDEDKLVFSSEMKSLLSYNIPKELDLESLCLYLQLNYVPAPQTMLKEVKKLMPGSYMKVSGKGKEISSFYKIDYKRDYATPLSYDQQKQKLRELLQHAVSKRLLADVPLGAFLSGGIDSSVIVALASEQVQQLSTFSIGYQDQPFFDETAYAQLVAQKFHTRHTVFSLTNGELYGHLQDLWDHLDEPFGDSSAIPTYILSKYTRKEVTVALSGDGADELLGGYNKHLALYRSFEGGLFTKAAPLLAPLARLFPQSRHNRISNWMRQLQRFSQGLSLPAADRYWLWATLATQSQAQELLNPAILQNLDLISLKERRQKILHSMNGQPHINDVLYTDMQLVLPNDMLTKVDWMSMAHGLEVRVPFLDHEVVDFCFSLPATSKIQGNFRKRILQDTFRDVLPKELYRRPKQGFEVPLLPWMRKELRGTIDNELLQKNFIEEQGIFNPDSITRLKKKLWSGNPGDTPANIWGLLVFQNWWKKYLA